MTIFLALIGITKGDTYSAKRTNTYSLQLTSTTMKINMMSINFCTRNSSCLTFRFSFFFNSFSSCTNCPRLALKTDPIYLISYMFIDSLPINSCQARAFVLTVCNLRRNNTTCTTPKCFNLHYNMVCSALLLQRALYTVHCTNIMHSRMPSFVITPPFLVNTVNRYFVIYPAMKYATFYKKNHLITLDINTI